MEVENSVRDLYTVLKAHSENISKWMTVLKKMKPQLEGDNWSFMKPNTWHFPTLSKTDAKQANTSSGQVSTQPNSQHDQSTDSFVIEDIRSRIQILETSISFAMSSMEKKFAERTGNKISLSTAQVFDRDGHIADDFMKTAPGLMKNQFKFTNVKNVKEIDKNKPLLVLCQTRSRLEPDMDYAWEELADVAGCHAATVIIHSKEEHALPKMSSQCKVMDSEKYKNMCLIDVAFTKEQKFYECSMNFEATKKLADFLSKKAGATAV